ncbi:MAG: ribonuclease E/G [Pseudomonadota bacterium]|nr:ribonuclease E/G [Pseudomonadota bacterium]
MTKRLLIDARQSEETRVVLLSGTRIEDFDYETENRKQLKGNVYLARVTRVEPSLQAAFVEYGGNRQGFLAFSEIHPDYYRIPIEDREALMAAERASNDAEDGDEDSDDAPETVGGEDADEEDIRPKRQVRKYKIQEVISRKQIMLVQVVKEERGNKGAALTTYLSLAGRYCVLMPNSTRRGGVSRKITNAADRKRLKTIVGGLDVQDGTAVIVRTAGAKRTKPEISRDYAYLSKLWDEIRTKTLESQAPSLIHEEGDLVKRSIRDLYTSEVDEVLVEGDEAYKEARSQMKMLIPSHVKRVQKYDDPLPIFQRYQVEQQMDTIHSPQVTLKSGGYLVINQTEALVAIDVNSGRSTRERNIEETALKTNLEAADELARQLRLRDLSGLIVVDFIDMEENRNQQAVERRMKDAMRNDRARIQIGSISHFGLLEMSRQRLRISFNESITSVCPHCQGTGRIRSVETAALQMLRVIEEEAMKGAMDELHISMNRDVALYILNHKRDAISTLEERFGLHIVILAGDSLIATEHEVERVGWQGKKARRQEKPAAKEPVADTEDDDEDDAAEASAEGTAETEDEQPKRRKRGRRGGRRRRRRGGDSADAATEAVTDGEVGDQPANDDEPSTASAEADSAANTDGDADGDPQAEAKPKSRRRSRGRGKAAADDKVAVEADTPADTPAETEAVAEASAEAPAEAEAEEKPKRRTRKKAAPAETVAVSGAEPAAEADGEAKAKPAAKKTRKKAAKSSGTAKKKTAKKAAKKAAKAKAAPVKDKAAGDSAGEDSDAEKRSPISSAPQDVIEVGSAEPAKRRTGWWNRG